MKNSVKPLPAGLPSTYRLKVTVENHPFEEGPQIVVSLQQKQKLGLWFTVDYRFTSAGRSDQDQWIADAEEELIEEWFSRELRRR